MFFYAAKAMEDAEGCWVDSVRAIDIRKEPLEDVDYEEFRPNFSELGHIDEDEDEA